MATTPFAPAASERRPGAGPPRAAAIVLSLLLALLIAYAFLWPRAAWLLIATRDRAVVERALAGAAANFSNTTPEDWRWMARPAVVRSRGRACVVILAWHPQPFHGRSGYKACYDARTGAVVEERASL
ncbi:MAG TPA: hypothetical protein VFQ67_14185 [Allosphingosinicella sp.]|jgi:hypothetical protein|nr:hypothetical protein [Allosphingosinicella sp.]